MKTKISISVILVILLQPGLWMNASEAIKTEVGGTGKICGWIRNATSNQPLGSAAATLFSASDSSMVAGTISNSDGSFVIFMLATGDYFLEISEPGFEKKHIAELKIENGQSTIDIGEIHLSPNTDTRKRAKLYPL